MFNASFVTSTQRSNSCRALASWRDSDAPLAEHAPHGECFARDCVRPSWPVHGSARPPAGDLRRRQDTRAAGHPARTGASCSDRSTQARTSPLLLGLRARDRARGLGSCGAGEHSLDPLADHRTGNWHHDLRELWPVACRYLPTEPSGVVKLAQEPDRQAKPGRRCRPRRHHRRLGFRNRCRERGDASEARAATPA